MNLNISAWAIRKPVPSLVLFMVLMALGYFSFQQLPITRFPEYRHPDRAGARVSVGRSAVGAGDAGHQEDRGCHRRRKRRQAHHVHGDGGLVADGHRVSPRDQSGPRAQRRQGRDRAHSGGAAAHHRGADRLAPGDRGPADHHLCGARAGHVAGGAVVVRRRHHRARRARRERRVADPAHRRRGARDPHRARCRPAAGVRHHGRRRQPAGAGDQCRSGGRTRRDRRARAGDPHAGRQADGRGSRAARRLRCRRAAKCVSTSSGR